MATYDDFKLHICNQLQDINFQCIYNTIKETGQYDRLNLKRILLILIYHLEINDNRKHIGLLSHYLTLFTKEKLYSDICLEQLLFIVAKCEQIYEKRSDSPLPPSGMYM